MKTTDSIEVKYAILRLVERLHHKADVTSAPISTQIMEGLNPEIEITPIRAMKRSSSLTIETSDADLGKEVVIHFNSDEAIPRQRFSIAHEYGHYLLHHKQALPVETSTDKERQEEEADFFASNFLVPPRLLDRLCPKIDYAPEHRAALEKETLKLASKFNVSRTCMNRAIFRLYHLRRVFGE